MDKSARYLLAAIQAIIGYEWLVSGADKLLLGRFPQGLADTLREGLHENPNGWFVELIQSLVLPHSLFFGYVIEIVELLIGMALLAGALTLIGKLPGRTERGYRLALVEVAAAGVAALGCAFLCANFHFFIGDGMLSGINAAHAYDEGIDLDTLLVPIALVIAFANLRLLAQMLGPETLRRWRLAFAGGPAAREHHITPA